MAAKGRSDDSLFNPSWKDRCIKLLEEAEVKNSTAENVKGKTNDLLKEKKELEDELKLIEEEVKKASMQLKGMENDANDKPISSSILKLYNLITKLKFAIESPANEVKGYIGGNSLETFQFDTATHSPQFIIDSLWNLIETQLKPNTAKKHSISDELMNSLHCKQMKRPKLCERGECEELIIETSQEIEKVGNKFC